MHLCLDGVSGEGPAHANQLAQRSSGMLQRDCIGAGLEDLLEEACEVGDLACSLLKQLRPRSSRSAQLPNVSFSMYSQVK